MIGIQLTDEKKVPEFLALLRENGLLALSAGHDVIRLLPPLVMTKVELQKEQSYWRKFYERFTKHSSDFDRKSQIFSEIS